MNIKYLDYEVTFSIMYPYNKEEDINEPTNGDILTFLKETIDDYDDTDVTIVKK